MSLFERQLASIVGIYISMISVVATYIRSQLFGPSYLIMFHELPQVDALWRFLNDIYFSRTAEEHAIENDLFCRLIYIYRNPHLLTYWTKQLKWQ